MDFPAGKTGLHYSVNFCRPENRPRFRVELYIDAKDKETALTLFREMERGRGVIEDRFGEPLEWDPLERSRGCRIANYFPDEMGVENRARWAELRAWAIERMGTLRDAFKPHIDSVN